MSAWLWGAVGGGAFVPVASAVPSGETLELAASLAWAALSVFMAVWFLRWRAARANARAGMGPGPVSGWVSPATTRLVLVCIALALVVAGAAPSFVRATDAYDLAMSTARRSARFGEALGLPASDGFEFHFGESPTAALTIPVSGPRARGTLQAAAVKVDGSWRLTRLTLELHADRDALVLLE